MKTNVKLLSFIALLASACTTGSMVTTGGYSDDAYFTPGNHPPVVSSAPLREQSGNHSTTISQLRQEDAGKFVDNYLSDQKTAIPNSNQSDLGTESATTENQSASDDEAQDLISDYDQPEEIDYTTRIRTFYDPYAYDPYWDSCYYPGFGFGWGLGFGGLYSGFGFGFGGYGGFYNPYFGGWGYPYGGGYYGGYYGGGYGHHNDGYNRDRYYGRQNSAGRGSSSAIGYSGAGRGAVGSTYSGGRSIGRSFAGSGIAASRGSNVVNNGLVTGSSRQAGTRFTVNPNQTRSANLRSSGQSGVTNNGQAITNLRRNQVVGQNNPALRSATTTNRSTYTPTYSRPRTNIQSSYNNGAARQYSRPQSFSGTTGSARSGVSSSYQSGSSRSPRVVSGTQSRSAGHISAPSRSSSSSATYSAPSRSSYSGGGSGGGSNRSSGGGGGGGGRRR